ncbi:MAG: MMPL family transporter [Pirellulaceae bacterium]|nr:MMPL family transporter [Pirellulaceae bacterium]
MAHFDQTSLSRRLFAWWADRPLVNLLVLLSVTGLAVLGYVDPSLVRRQFQRAPANDVPPATGLETVPQPVKPVDRPPDVEPFRVGGGDCVVVATSQDLFRQENLQAIRLAVARLEALPQVSQVLWIDSIPGLNLFGLPEPLLPHPQASARQIEQSRQRTLANPLAVGQLISRDGTTLLLHLRIDWFQATTDAASTTELREAAEAAVAEVPGSDVRFQVTGRAPLYLMMAHNHLRDSWRYQAIGYSIMLITALVLFRGMSAVTIVAVAPALGVFWTMGMLRFFNLHNNPFNDIIVPVLISLVGLTDAVHLMVEVRNQRAEGHEPREAARRAVVRVGMACALTSLTTAIGFASLAWAHHEIVRDFGWSCVLGVGLTFVSVLTVVPLGCRSPLGRRLHVGLGTSLIDRQLRRIGPLVGWVLRRDRRVAWLAVVVTLVLAAACTRLQPDEKRYSGLSESGEAARALRHLDRTLGGLEFGSVRITWDSDSQPGELLEVLRDVQRALGDEPLMGQPLGLHDLLAALPGDGTADERMTLLELLPASLKRAFYAPEERRASVQFRVQDIGIARYGPVFARVEAALAEISRRHPAFQLELEGDAIWRWRNVYQILTDLATSLGTASLVIWLIMTIAYRSIRIGLISIVPNLFPLVATGALLLLAGQYLELVTVCVFTICVGIAVDDTIHFLTRYTDELAATPAHDPEAHRAVIQRAFAGVGSALLMTTIVLVMGMVTAIFGDARDARLFGTMGAITLASALFADVVFLPALLSRFALPRSKVQP